MLAIIMLLSWIYFVFFSTKTTRTTTQDYIKKGISYLSSTSAIKYQQLTGFGKHGMQELRDEKESQGRSYPNANETSGIKKLLTQLKFFSNTLGSADKKGLANDNLTNISRNRNNAYNWKNCTSNKYQKPVAVSKKRVKEKKNLGKPTQTLQDFLRLQFGTRRDSNNFCTNIKAANGTNICTIRDKDKNRSLKTNWNCNQSRRRNGNASLFDNFFNNASNIKISKIFKGNETYQKVPLVMLTSEIYSLQNKYKQKRYPKSKNFMLSASKNC